MSVYKHIKEATKQIEFLKNRFEKTQNKKQQIYLMKLINSYVNLLNDCESLLNKQLQTDVVDRLILARIYSQLFAASTNAAIDIHKITQNIDFNLTETRQLQKWRIINFLRGREIESVVEQLPFKNVAPFNNKLMASKKEANAAYSKLTEVTTIEEYDAKIESLLTEFKQTIQWN